MAAPSYRSRWPIYASQWNQATILSSKASSVAAVAKRLVAAKDRYVAVEKVTGVPWYMIAAIHERESSQNWKASLAQGDPWNRVSTHVPRGRGPFSSWEAAAIDALRLDGLSRVKDWRLEKIIYYWELYNGWGYAAHAIPSPYVWAATSIQKPGKYIADGVWSSTAMDQQLGCVAMLKGMMAIDPSIRPIRETAGDEEPAVVIRQGQPPVNPPAPASTAKPAVAVTGGAVAAAGGAAVAAHSAGLRPWHIVLIVAGIVLTALAGWVFYKKKVA
jgi:lysozyme family protein